MSSTKDTPHQLINPAGHPKPKGYSDGVLAVPGRMLFVAGQIGWDEDGQVVSDQFVPQFERALRNILDVVHEAGGSSEHVVRLTIYVTDKREYTSEIKAVGEAYRRQMGRHFPAMALVQVADLLMPGSKVEIEATAVIPS